MPKYWTETLECAKYTVFWAGPHKALLKDNGEVKLAMKRQLARIEAFPWSFSETSQDWEI